MASQRLAARGLMRLSKPNAFITPKAMGSVYTATQARPLQTQTVTETSAHDILASQRLNRPISPHLTIYQPQLTWYLSSLNRVTGVTLSGSLYVFSIAYLAGLVDTASLVSGMASLPVALKVGLKGVAAFPFAFHSWNGIRHLVWDTASELSVKGVYRTGYTVLGLTTVTTVGLMFL